MTHCRSIGAHGEILLNMQAALGAAIDAAIAGEEGAAAATEAPAAPAASEEYVWYVFSDFWNSTFQLFLHCLNGHSFGHSLQLFFLRHF
jgi:hypothetical protein